MRTALQEFTVREKVLATVEASSRNEGILSVSGGGGWEPGKAAAVPGLVMAAEHYNEILRLLEHDQPVELAIDVTARFNEDDPQAYNTVAEIPGTDKRDEIVLAGAHLDSWHTGTGATDNAAGSAVVMEAARILKALGVKPRRTIRFALWTGEEQGLFGSIAYVRSTSRPVPSSRAEGARTSPPSSASRPGRSSSSPSTPSSRPTSTSTTAAAGSAASTPRRTPRSSRSSPPGSPPSPTSGPDTVTLRNTGSTDHVSSTPWACPASSSSRTPWTTSSRPTTRTSTPTTTSRRRT